MDKENVTISRIFSHEIIPMDDIAAITLHASAEKGINIYITFQTKNNRNHKWFCDSFKSAERITTFIRNRLPGIFIEETEGFRSKRQANAFLYKPIKLFDFFNRNKKE